MGMALTVPESQKHKTALTMAAVMAATVKRTNNPIDEKRHGQFDGRAACTATENSHATHAIRNKNAANVHSEAIGAS